MSPVSRKRKAESAKEEQPGPDSSSVAPPQPRILQLAQSARRRAVTCRYHDVKASWDRKREARFGVSTDELQQRLELALNFWRGAGCELCAAYRDYAAADTHDMEECRNWEEAPEAQRILRLLEEASVRASADEDESSDEDGSTDEYGSTDEDESTDGDENATTSSPCKVCTFLSKRCPNASPRVTAPDGTVEECENMEVVWRAVAALLSFEDSLLADKVEWVKTDDPAAILAWMAEKEFSDWPSSLISAIARDLDELYGSYECLLADDEYRVDLLPRGKMQDTVVALPTRCSDEPVGPVIDCMDADVLAMEQRLVRLEELSEEIAGTRQRLRDSRCTEPHLRKLRDDSATEQENRKYALFSEWHRLASYIETTRDMKPLCLRLRSIEPRLLHFRDACMVCRAMGKPSDHSIRVCTNEMAQRARTDLIHVERAVNFDLFHGCHRCGMPKLICSRWAKQKGEVRFRLMPVPGRCSYEGVALEVIYGIKHSYKAIWDAWIRRLEHKRVRQDNQDWICKYLCSQKESEQPWYSQQKWEYRCPTSNLLWEFEWITLLM